MRKSDLKAASENDILVHSIMLIYRKIPSDVFIGIVHILHTYEKIEKIDFEGTKTFICTVPW